MKINAFLPIALSVGMLLFTAAGCNKTSEKSTVNETAVVTNDLFRIAPVEYAQLAETSIMTLAKFDFTAWESMLADDVEYDFPDGDQNSRTKLMGKAAVVAWWKKFKETSGIESMTMNEFNNMPIEVTGEAKGGAKKGIYVISYFTNTLVFNGKPVGLRMNFSTHFNADKKIDRYATYYDRTPIIKAMGGKNLLENMKAKK